MSKNRSRMWAMVVIALAAASVISIKYHQGSFDFGAAEQSAAGSDDGSPPPMYFRYDVAANGQVYVCSGFRGRVLVRDIASGLTLHALELQGKFWHDVVCDDDGSSILTACRDGTIVFWTRQEDVYRSRMLHRFESPAVCALSKDGQLALLGTENGRVEIRDTKMGKRLQLIATDAGWIRCVRFSPDDAQILYSCQDGTVHLWDCNQSVEVGCFQPGSDPIVTAEFSPDGQRVVTGQFDGWIRIWDLESAQEICRTRLSADPVTAARFSPCGRFVAVGTVSGVVSLMRADDRTVLVTWRERNTVKYVEFSPDGRRLYAGLAGQQTALQQYDIPISRDANATE